MPRAEPLRSTSPATTRPARAHGSAAPAAGPSPAGRSPAGRRAWRTRRRWRFRARTPARGERSRHRGRGRAGPRRRAACCAGSRFRRARPRRRRRAPRSAPPGRCRRARHRGTARPGPSVCTRSKLASAPGMRMPTQLTTASMRRARRSAAQSAGGRARMKSSARVSSPAPPWRLRGDDPVAAPTQRLDDRPADAAAGTADQDVHEASFFSRRSRTASIAGARAREIDFRLRAKTR